MSHQEYARPEVLVSTQWVADHLDDRNIRLVESNEDILLYNTGHIPGAVKIDWFGELNDPIVRDYLDGKHFARLMSSKGISRDTTVVFYGDKNHPKSHVRTFNIKMILFIELVLTPLVLFILFQSGFLIGIGMIIIPIFLIISMYVIFPLLTIIPKRRIAQAESGIFWTNTSIKYIDYANELIWLNKPYHTIKPDNFIVFNDN